MRNVKIVLLIALMIILSMSTYGQEKQEYQNKVELQKIPAELKKEISKYNGYKINKAAYKVEAGKKVYRLEIKKGQMEHVLILDEKGKIIGREEN